MRRFLSGLLAFVLVLGTVPGVSLAGTSTAASVANVATEGELTAALADVAVTDIVLTADISTTAQITVSRPVAIDGAGHRITVSANLGTVNGSKHAISVNAGTAATPVIIRDVSVDSSSNAYGMNTYGDAHLQLDGVSLARSRGAGLTVNGSTVTATGLTTSGNAWGAVNVDPGSGVSTPSAFTLVSGVLGEAIKIWSDGRYVTPTASVTIDAAALGYVAVPTGVGTTVWTVPRTVQVSDAAGLVAAIRDLQPADTIELAAGTYDVERLLGDMTFGGQTGWYLPLWRPGVTVRGAGVGETTVTSSVESANGVWSSQDFFTVWANGVTIEGMTIVPKRDTNKAIEVMGKDFTLRDVEIVTNAAGPEIGAEFYEFGGSVYFNPQTGVTGLAGDVGQSRLDGVFIESAWISAGTSVVTTGTIALNDVTLDWVDAGYAPYGYGVMSANPLLTVESGVVVIVDETMSDLAAQVSSRVPAGTVVEFVGEFDAGVPASIFTNLQRNGEFPDSGELLFASPDVSASGVVPFAWTFPVSSLDASFTGSFAMGVQARTTLATPLRFGPVAIELACDQSGDIPGPAALTVYVGSALSGRTFDVHRYGTDGLSDSLAKVVVDAEGYVTVGVDAGGQWYLIESREHNVVFDACGGGTIPGQTVTFGSLIDTPTAAPAKRGYRFLGWYADWTYATPWDFANDVVTRDMTLYARYAALPKVALGNVVASRWMSHTRSYQVYGSLRPRHAAGSYPVRIYRYRLENGRWKAYGYILAKASDFSTYTKYSRTTRLPYPGLWRLRAYAPADAGHAGTWSSSYTEIHVM